MKRKFYKAALKQRLKTITLLQSALCIILFAGCRSLQQASDNITAQNTQGNPTQMLESESTATTAPTETTPAPTATITPTPLQFSALSKYEFVFLSGAGAWQTVLYINDDGTFIGSYTDADMGDTGIHYPAGTVYSSAFKGKFTTPIKVNDYTYSMEIEHINLEKEMDTVEIINGTRYIYTEPYGLENAKEIYIYTPHAPIKDLPEAFREWVGYPDLNDLTEEYLPFYGLYNVESEYGFSGKEIKADN